MGSWVIITKINVAVIKFYNPPYRFKNHPSISVSAGLFLLCFLCVFVCLFVFCCIFYLISLFFCLSHRWGWAHYCVIPFLKENHFTMHPSKALAPSSSPTVRYPLSLSVPLSWLLTSCPFSRVPRVSCWAQLERDNAEMMKCCAVIPPTMHASQRGPFNFPVGLQVLIGSFDTWRWVRGQRAEKKPCSRV